MSNEKEIGAVEWLIENLNHLEMKKSLYKPIDFRIKKQRIIDQAKEMDKEQKKHAYDWGETNGADGCNGDGATHENFEQYYQETYGGNK
jgi:hypothetical protein